MDLKYDKILEGLFKYEQKREMKPTFHLTFSLSLSFIRINQQLYDGLKNGNLNNKHNENKTKKFISYSRRERERIVEVYRDVY